MRIALIGAGQIGAAHAERLARLPDVSELLIANQTHAKAEALAERIEKGRAVSVDDAFSPSVDGIVVTTNAASHAALIHRAIDAYRPVLCEKPIAQDIRTTREVVDHSEANPDVPVQIAFQRRFDAGYGRARELYRSGALGFVHTLHATTYDVAPPPAAYIPTSGGLFKDCSVHDFDAIRWLTGREAVRVSATGSNKGADFFSAAGDVDSGAALVTYDDATMAFVGASRYHGAGHDVRLELHGSEGSAFVGLDDRAPLVTTEKTLSWTQSPPYQTYHERFSEAFVQELTHFVEVVGGAPSRACSPGDALEALLAAEACGMSLRRGEPVELAELRS